ncbi:hypothetical protein [Spiroplasma poulsonii]|uniref:Uncharacterized protein n=1 Tax=Spiroplasma poulsonii TaxID=2138 RepID=A0A2P6FA40_9MOLU|nr:hypothetical protein [Spiroplasma poulsonii]KAF0852118.1 putative adhesin [Spiroplasma poulsonii]PQM30308.1 hypothetical protein SMSRO_SF000660 [Spiroplasma poulsonii]PWF95273.1 hypothetical protein SMSE_06980 [Spiroplasma poulsonii]PWF98061.1 hypothetical protein SMH99_06110 [Spiroplasma poulsonii]
MSRINPRVMEELRRQAHDTLIDIRENIKDNRHWIVFPFNVYSSYIPDTETGWKPNNAKPSDYGSYSRIFDNMESTIAQWQDSLKIVQKYKGEEINILTIDDFNKQPVDSTIWTNNETPFAIKLKGENINYYWKLIDGENIYDVNKMLEYLNQYKLSYFMNNDNRADNFYTKEVRVGKYWDAYMIDDRSSIQFGEAKFEQVFTQQSTERQYTLLILDEDADKLNINDYYNFYTVFNDRGLNIGGGDINSAPQDRQWLYPSNVINYYSPYDGSFLWQEITFSSINDKISNSGLSVRQFIQTSAPGEGYCFPKITYDEKLNKGIVELDEVLLKDPGVRAMAVKFYGNPIFFDMPVIGRPIIKGQFNKKVMNSRDLLMYNMYPAPPDKINTYSSPEVSWYNVQGIQPTMITGYEDWKKDMESRYNFWNQKNSEGIVITDPATTSASNSTVGRNIHKEDNDSKFYWSKSWKITPPNKVKVNSGNVDNIISTQASSYFRRKDEFGNTVGQVQIEYNKMGACNIWDILNMNNFINRQITVLPLNYTQKLVFNPFTIPGGVGKFLNFISFGIPWGWVINQDEKTWPNFQWLNGFMSANIYSFYNDAFWSEKSKGKGYLPFEIFREQGNDKVGAIFGANATSLGFTTLLTDKVLGDVLHVNGELDTRTVYSTYNLKQLNPKTNRIYLINELVRAVDLQTPVSDSEKDNNCEFLQTPDGTNCSYIIDMFSIQALYKGNFEIIFYADNPYTNNEEDYLKLSVWSFRGKTKSTLNNYLRDMTTNYKTSFLLPHDYEIPTFNYPEYVLPPVPYNYKPYTKDIWDANTVQALKTKITAPSQCKHSNNPKSFINLFDNTTEYKGYYEIEIDLRQIDPTIQSISKFQDSYKTIEISNLDNLQVSCIEPDIKHFIRDRNVNILGGYSTCEYNFGPLSDATLHKKGLPQKDNVNFESTKTLYTENIKVNDTETIYVTAYTNGLSSGNYQSEYTISWRNWDINFLLQITKLSDNDNNKITETYLQAYYTNDMKLKIRFSKVLLAKLLGYCLTNNTSWGNDKDITIDVNALGVLNMINNSNNPVKITFTPR